MIFRAYARGYAVGWNVDPNEWSRQGRELELALHPTSRGCAIRQISSSSAWVEAFIPQGGMFSHLCVGLAVERSCDSPGLTMTVIPGDDVTAKSDFLIPSLLDQPALISGLPIDCVSPASTRILEWIGAGGGNLRVRSFGCGFQRGAASPMIVDFVTSIALRALAFEGTTTSSNCLNYMEPVIGSGFSVVECDT